MIGTGAGVMGWTTHRAELVRQMVEAGTGETYRAGIRHGTMEAGLYRPRGTDPQQPHDQDELYVIVSGQATFTKAGETRAVCAGDLIFVEAGAEHRFDSFGDDFECWAIFWGPPGGEAAASGDPTADAG